MDKNEVDFFLLLVPFTTSCAFLLSWWWGRRKAGNGVGEKGKNITFTWKMDIKLIKLYRFLKEKLYNTNYFVNNYNTRRSSKSLKDLQRPYLTQQDHNYILRLVCLVFSSRQNSKKVVPWKWIILFALYNLFIFKMKCSGINECGCVAVALIVVVFHLYI